MFKLVAIASIQIAIYASILSLYFTLQPLGTDRPWWHWLLVAFAIIACFLLILREIVAHMRSVPKTYRSPRKINLYMRKWVSSGGRVVIFSRDMSWTDDEATRQVLREKAGRNELTICLEHPIRFTNELRQQGAQIVTYGALGHVPLSRFTIVDFGREGARVAVGVKVGNDLVIQEFRSGDHPFFAVAEDLVKLLLASSGKMLNVPQG